MKVDATPGRRRRPIALTSLIFTFFVISTFSQSVFIEPKIFLTGIISGRVFQDFNGNGAFDTTGGTAAAPTAVDIGVAGVIVTVYDAGGIQRGTAATAADGTFSISATGTGPYRVEFTSVPAGFSPSARSTDSVSGGSTTDAGSTVQFVADGNTANVNLGLVRPVDYCQDNPTICSQLYGLFGANQPESIFTIPYYAGSTRTTGGTPVTDFTAPVTTSLATTNQVGTTFGLAHRRATWTIFTSAFMKKHAAFGPGGTGAIYAINRGTGAVTQHANLNTIFGANTAGANPHNTADYSTDNGNATFDAVGKVAFGGMSTNATETLLYTMNLANRTLYEIPTNVIPTAGNIRTSVFPATMPGCTNASDVRLFAVSFYEGLIYVGAVCSADVSDSPADVDAYVYTVNPTTLVFSANPVFRAALNYNRNAVDPGAPAEWLAWRTNFSTLAGLGILAYPQPMLTDIDFDRGNLILSIRDRMGDQTGFGGAQSNPADVNDLRKGITAGEILRACGNPTLGWTLESNGRCGGIGSAPQNTGEGPGEGEYYYQDSYHPDGNPHDEVGLGAAHQIPGHNVMVATIFDPVYIPNDNIFDAGGFRWFVNNGAAAGSQNRGYLAYSNGDFGKANGVGNVIALCDTAPIEIGNRVWRDLNGNGVQDPGEAPIAGVTVRLFNSSNVLIATAVTDANGEYYFISGTAADPNAADNIGIVNGQILPSTAYQVRFDNPANYLSGGPLFTLIATQANQTSQQGDDDSSDSDAVNVINPVGSPPGTFPIISLTTGAAGSNNHTIDAGFRTDPSAATASISGQIFSPNGNGVRNVRVTLTEENGAIRTAVTSSFGFYRFEDIEVGQTVILSIYSKRFTFREPTRLLNLNDNLANVDFTADD